MRLIHRRDGSSRLTTRRRLEITGNHAVAPIHLRRRRSLVSLTLAGLLAASGAAAYYILEGVGNGNTGLSTGTPATVPVTVGSLPATENGGGALLMLPESSLMNGASETAWWSLTDSTASTITNFVPTIVTSGGDVVNQSTGLPVANCLASWFQLAPFVQVYNPPDLTDVLPSPMTLSPSDPLDAAEVVWLQNVVGTNQGACEGISPEVNLAVS